MPSHSASIYEVPTRCQGQCWHGVSRMDGLLRACRWLPIQVLFFLEVFNTCHLCTQFNTGYTPSSSTLMSLFFSEPTSQMKFYYKLLQSKANVFLSNLPMTLEPAFQQPQPREHSRKTQINTEAASEFWNTATITRPLSSEIHLLYESHHLEQVSLFSFPVQRWSF